MTLTLGPLAALRQPEQSSPSYPPLPLFRTTQTSATSRAQRPVADSASCNIVPGQDAETVPAPGISVAATATGSSQDTRIPNQVTLGENPQESSLLSHIFAPFRAVRDFISYSFSWPRGINKNQKLRRSSKNLDADSQASSGSDCESNATDNDDSDYSNSTGLHTSYTSAQSERGPRRTLRSCADGYNATMSNEENEVSNGMSSSSQNNNQDLRSRHNCQRDPRVHNFSCDFKADASLLQHVKNNIGCVEFMFMHIIESISNRVTEFNRAKMEKWRKLLPDGFNSCECGATCHCHCSCISNAHGTTAHLATFPAQFPNEPLDPERVKLLEMDHVLSYEWAMIMRLLSKYNLFDALVMTGEINVKPPQCWNPAVISVNTCRCTRKWDLVDWTETAQSLLSIFARRGYRIPATCAPVPWSRARFEHHYAPPTTTLNPTEDTSINSVTQIPRNSQLSSSRIQDENTALLQDGVASAANCSSKSNAARELTANAVSGSGEGSGLNNVSRMHYGADRDYATELSRQPESELPASEFGSLSVAGDFKSERTHPQNFQSSYSIIQQNIFSVAPAICEEDYVGEGSSNSHGVSENQRGMQQRYQGSLNSADPGTITRVNSTRQQVSNARPAHATANSTSSSLRISTSVQSNAPRSEANPNIVVPSAQNAASITSPLFFDRSRYTGYMTNSLLASESLITPPEATSESFQSIRGTTRTVVEGRSFSHNEVQTSALSNATKAKANESK